jgi:hypothetical protein
LGATAAHAQSSTYVDGYYRADGTYVPGHYRTTPNRTTLDNYGTNPNTNPNTGEPGTRRTRESTESGYSMPSRSTQTPAYQTQTLYTGPRGGTFYINDAGNEVYVK